MSNKHKIKPMVNAVSQLLAASEEKRILFSKCHHLIQKKAKGSKYLINLYEKQKNVPQAFMIDNSFAVGFEYAFHLLNEILAEIPPKTKKEAA